MSIPDYQAMMLPLLRLIADQQEHRLGDTYGRIADEFGLSPEERRELLPSGKSPVVNNRVAWAKTYLAKAGLIETPKRGVLRITRRGLDLLSQNPSRIDKETLRQYPEFVSYVEPWTESSASTERERKTEPKETPDELLETAYQDLRRALAAELLEHVRSSSPARFEKLVIDLLRSMGYGSPHMDAARVVGKSGDAGIDGIIEQDRLGLDVVYVQAKRWSDVVGRPEIQRFAGALQGQRSKKGVFITTSSFSSQAKEYARSIDSNIVLIDGNRLAQLMIDFDIGVSKIDTYVIKRVDTHDFAEE